MDVDVCVVGAGAAGLFAALAARGALARDGTVGPASADAPGVLLVDGQDPPGRKILVSGGGRCNVTNARVTEADYGSTEPKRVRSVLRAFDVAATRRAFASIGVDLAEEPLGKLFPTTGRARDVLDALLAAVVAAGVTTRFGAAVEDVRVRDDGRWQVGDVVAARVVVATGGRSVPATGSTGFGLDLATTSGHTVVPPLAALAPLLGDADADLAGITVPVVLRVVDAADGRERTRAAGSLLFTHRGVTGPAPLDVSVEVERAAAAGEPVRVLADLWSLADPDGPFGAHLTAPKAPGACLADPPRPVDVGVLDGWLRDRADADPRATLATVAAERLPRRLAAAVVGDAGTPLGQLRREDRRGAARALASFELHVDATAGFARAEVTAGGVSLRELDTATMASRVAPGSHWCGEVCDATGRLGGFNFQWAWASGAVAGWGAARALGSDPTG